MTNKYDEEFLPTQPGWDLPSQQKPARTADPLTATTDLLPDHDLGSSNASALVDPAYRPLSEYARSAPIDLATPMQPAAQSQFAPQGASEATPVVVAGAGNPGLVGPHTNAAHLPPTPPQRFAFTGSGSEYFRIWIVNLLLTILTLGIYSAWAKVRKTKYFYNNTRVAGQTFEYHGNPVAILKGRIIAVGIFGLYNLAFYVHEVLGGIAILAMYVVLPWMIWKSLQFKLYNTSYRSLRFGFSGSLMGSFLVFTLIPIAVSSVLGIVLVVLVMIGIGVTALTKSALVVAVLGVMVFVVLAVGASIWHHQFKKYQVSFSRFGVTQFAFGASVKEFSRAYLMTGFVFACILAALGLIAYSIIPNELVKDLFSKSPGVGAILLGFLFLGIFYAALFTFMPIVLAMIHNVVWNNTKLGAHRFTSDLSVPMAVWVAVSNIVAIILTLGLFIPFAQIRTAKLRVESITLVPASDLDAFAADQQRQAEAMGEGVADLLDLNIGM